MNCGIEMKKSESIYLMGTTIDITVSHPKAVQVIEKVTRLLEMYEKRFSANDSTSELNQINHQAGIRPVKVHPDLYELIAIGKKHSAALTSHLNIAIGPLVQSWRIGFGDAEKPSDQVIEELLSKIDVDQVLLFDHHVYLKSKGMALDLGALAKGYIADRIIEYLQSVGTESALINLGGNLVTIGSANQHQDKRWRVGIRNPEGLRDQTQIVLKIQDQSVVTSGIYERQLTEQGKQYHHILDSTTGYPVETDVASLTIVSEASIDGEIWTGRLFGQPIPVIMKTINNLSGIEGLVIDRYGKVSYSKGMNDLLI